METLPKHDLLILLAEHESELLPTIVSRCRVLRFGELAADDVAGVLRAAGVPAEELALRSRWSSGSPGRAMAELTLEVGPAADDVLKALASGDAYRDPMELIDQLIKFSGGGRAEGAHGKRERIAAFLLSGAWGEAMAALWGPGDSLARVE